MGEWQVRRLAVLDAGNEVVGIVALGDLATRQSAQTDEALREISTPGRDAARPEYGAIRSDRLIGPAAHHVLRHPGAFMWQTLKAFKANQGLLLAGAVAYYALLSIVPLLILIVIALSHCDRPGRAAGDARPLPRMAGAGAVEARSSASSRTSSRTAR